MSTRDPKEFENPPAGTPVDETDLSLRSYLCGLSEDHLGKYDPSWSDDQVKAWDGNFRNDGCLMLVCCERDVEVAEFRRMVEAYLRFRRA